MTGLAVGTRVQLDDSHVPSNVGRTAVVVTRAWSPALLDRDRSVLLLMDDTGEWLACTVARLTVIEAAP